MLAWILGLLGVGGVAAVVIYLLTAFGIFGALKLPAFIVNAASLVVETFLRVVAWIGETFLHGEENIWSTWQGLFAQIMVIIIAMLVGSAPLVALLHWKPWHSKPAVEASAPEGLLSGEPLHVKAKHHFPHVTVKRKQRHDDIDMPAYVRHQLGA